MNVMMMSTLNDHKYKFTLASIVVTSNNNKLSGSDKLFMTIGWVKARSGRTLRYRPPTDIYISPTINLNFPNVY